MIVRPTAVTANRPNDPRLATARFAPVDVLLDAPVVGRREFAVGTRIEQRTRFLTVHLAPPGSCGPLRRPGRRGHPARVHGARTVCLPAAPSARRTNRPARQARFLLRRAQALAIEPRPIH